MEVPAITASTLGNGAGGTLLIYRLAGNAYLAETASSVELTQSVESLAVAESAGWQNRGFIRVKMAVFSRKRPFSAQRYFGNGEIDAVNCSSLSAGVKPLVNQWIR